VAHKHPEVLEDSTWKMTVLLAEFLQQHMAFEMTDNQLEDAHEKFRSYMTERFAVTKKYGEDLGITSQYS